MIYSIFARNLHSNPEKIALVDSEGKAFTYTQTQHRINQWANYLVKQGIESGDRVAVLLDNEDMHVFIFLALDRINACYVPFDIDIPKSQLSLDIATLHLKKFLVSSTLDFTIDESLKLSLSEDELTYIHQTEPDEPECSYQTNGLKKISYIVSSSGTTGNKRWIPILGEGLVYWANTETKLFELFPVTSILSTRSPAYDARISEYVRAFAHGATLHFLPHHQRKDLKSILLACREKFISCLLLIASQLRTFDMERIIAELEAYGVEHLMVTGDACTLELKNLCEYYGIHLWNCYGPTEATFGLSILRINNIRVYNIVAHEIQILIPIGEPDQKIVRYHIIDEQLYIESPYLTPGYLNPYDNDTAFKTILDENGNTIRLFATGDKFYKTEGHLIHQGRINNESHCKINGVKVYWQRIEQCLMDYAARYPGQILNLAVVIKKHLDTLKPFAYLITSPAFDNDTIAQHELVKHLHAHLIDQEFPMFIRWREPELPHAATSGKIDRHTLVARYDLPEEFFFIECSSKKDADTEPVSTENLQILKKIWSRLLGINEEILPLDRSFLELGGDSLMAAVMVNEIIIKLDEDYRYQHLRSLKTVTLREMAEHLTGQRIQTSTQTFINRLAFISEEKSIWFFLPALDGEGYFSLRHLAARVSREYDCNVYGLSDPGINHKEGLPVSMRHAVHRYILAIQSIQPRGPYRLLGFSFGATLATEVAMQLRCEFDVIEELHLVDGIPPVLYQALSSEAYIDLLKTLAGFLINTFNNNFYKETLDASTLIHAEEIIRQTKHQQLDTVFDNIEKKLKNHASKCTLAVAKRHLSFLLTIKPPKEKFNIWPVFYLTNTKQPYLKIIETIPHIPRLSAESLYYGWNHYFHQITLCGAKLEGDHLSVLRAGPDIYKQSPDCFFQRVGDSIVNMAFVDEYGPTPFYRAFALRSSSQSEYLIAGFFMHTGSIERCVPKLTKLGLFPKILHHDQNLLKYDNEDTIYISMFNIFCIVPDHLMESVKSIITSSFRLRRPLLKINDSKREFAAHTFFPWSNIERIDSAAMPEQCIDLTLSAEIPILRLSFKCRAIHPIKLQAMQHKWELTLEVSGPKCNHLHFIYYGMGGCNIYAQFFGAEEFLANFISMLEPYIDQTSLQDNSPSSKGP